MRGKLEKKAWFVENLPLKVESWLDKGGIPGTYLLLNPDRSP